MLLINLDSRPDRLARFREQAAAVPALAGWQRLAAVAGTVLPGYGDAPWFRGRSRDRAWAGRAGCVLSHRRAIELARERGWRSVLILEDDVEFDAALDAALRTPALAAAQWDICYLGYSRCLGPLQRLAALDAATSLYAVQGAYTTHAYLVRASLYDWLLQQLPDAADVWPWLARHRAIDRWYARHLAARFHVAAVSPTRVGQFSDFSDIGQRAPGPDRDRHLHGRLASDRAVGPAAFRLGLGLRRLQFALTGLWDVLRAGIKQLRGF
ncbi:glycosyltransferase family 25 protein [Thiohalobacter thiocyanaticus]|uniref:Glycosyl transferase n=1 Tax=Thiohalobacter thiocyanaticus TaxID=585455 RepID=A0A426QIM1_9GAMM|nr:glycosyl transferase [Thiohalobacter thiocyanaticus]RRQ21612.1 glycosyl transferase [Thiohalobacter thiocyanaticus]